MDAGWYLTSACRVIPDYSSHLLLVSTVISSFSWEGGDFSYITLGTNTLQCWRSVEYNTRRWMLNIILINLHVLDDNWTKRPGIIDDTGPFNWTLLSEHVWVLMQSFGALQNVRALWLLKAWKTWIVCFLTHTCIHTYVHTRIHTNLHSKIVAGRKGCHGLVDYRVFFVQMLSII